MEAVLSYHTMNVIHVNYKQERRESDVSKVLDLEYSDMQSVNEPTFRRKISPQSSGPKIGRARNQRASRWLGPRR
jgi:hypothetical protein